MSEQLRFAPLVEVACEFRFQPGESWDAAIPGLLAHELRERFPKRQPALRLQTSIEAGPEVFQHEVRPLEGLLLLGEAEDTRVLVSPHVMSVAHLRPYPGWDSFVGLISGALDAYWSVAKPAGYLRVGLRYINRIALPGTRIELEEYFDFYPFVGKRLPQDQTGFLVSIHIPYEEGRDLLRLQLGSADPEQEQALAFVLDLDYFLSQPEAVAPADVMGWLGDAHARIKDAFAGSIKPLLWQRFAGEDAEA